VAHRESFTPVIWEFNVVFAEFEPLDDRRMNELGEQRWELLSVVTLPKDRYVYTFRRPR